MKYPKSIVVPALLLLLVAAIAGYVMSSCKSSNPERQKIVRTIGKSLLKVVRVAYKSGGNKLAESKINSLVGDGKLDERQATALKAVLKEGGGAIENIVADPGKKLPAVPINKIDKNTPNDLTTNMLYKINFRKKVRINTCFTSRKEPIADANIRV